MTLTELMSAAGTDIDELLGRYHGNTAILEQGLRKFSKNPTFSSLRRAVMTRDLPLVEIQSYTLKTISTNLGFSYLAQQCACLAEEVRTKKNARIKSQFFLIEQEYKRLVSMLRRLV